MLNLVRFFAAAALLAFALPATAADLIDGPRPVVRGYGGGALFVGRAPSFVFTAGYRYPHAQPYFLGPSPACAWLDVPVWRRGVMETRHVYRCW